MPRGVAVIDEQGHESDLQRIHDAGLFEGCLANGPRHYRLRARYGERQVGLMCELASVLEGFASDEEYSATITDLQEVAERAVACRIPISVSAAEAVQKPTGSVVRGETYRLTADDLRTIELLPNRYY